MSTYLVAIVVGLFDCVEAPSLDGIIVRVYTQIGNLNQGKFALDVAVKALELYIKYFSVPYPLPKLDMVGIPDFAAGAMENFGLVTYREIALLYDELHSSAWVKQSVICSQISFLSCLIDYEPCFVISHLNSILSLIIDLPKC
ncbi:hypothetical protein BHE74_00013846 [Ensete ventricosum]|nr:hypothetical protein BHE74_00013846 [Ensete ventricosum]